MATRVLKPHSPIVVTTPDPGAPNSLFIVARTSLIVLLMAAPLAFGAVLPWGWGAIAVVAACLLVLWAAGSVRVSSVKLIWSPLYVSFAVFLLLAWAQIQFALTLDRVGTREALIKLAAYVIIFFLAQHLFADASQRVWRRTAGAVALYAFAMALFAIIQLFASPGLLYGFIKPRWGGMVFGPYVYHNAYAGLMEVLIPVAVVFALSLRPRHPAKPFLLFAIFVCMVSVFLSGSRGGLIALAVEFALLAGAIFLGEPGTRKRALVAGLVLTAIAGASFSWLDPGDIWKRWEAVAHTPEIAMGDRDKVTMDTLRMSRDHLAHGIGLGAFETVYPKYQSIATDLVYDYAHDDYAQLFAETGVLGWIFAPASIVIFVLLSFRDLRSRLEHPVGWLQLGAAVAVCGLLVHSLFDFNMHIPANAAWFAFCAALATVKVTAPPPGPRRIWRPSGAHLGVTVLPPDFSILSPPGGGTKE
jgi:O-antigen ligase